MHDFDLTGAGREPTAAAELLPRGRSTGTLRPDLSADGLYGDDSSMGWSSGWASVLEPKSQRPPSSPERGGEKAQDASVIRFTLPGTCAAARQLLPSGS